jgi:putative addiction module component
MSRRREQIEAEALRLGMKSRAALAERLLQSLDPPNACRTESEWFREAERRDRELDRGGTTVPARELLRRLKSGTARKRRSH